MNTYHTNIPPQTGHTHKHKNMRPSLPPSTTAAASTSLRRGLNAQQGRASYSRGRNVAIGTPAASSFTSGPQGLPPRLPLLPSASSSAASAAAHRRRRGRLLEQAVPGVVVTGQQKQQQHRAFHASTRTGAPKRDFYEVLGKWKSECEWREGMDGSISVLVVGFRRIC